MPAAVLAAAAGAVLVGLPSPATPSAVRQVAPQALTLAESGLMPSLPADAVAEEQVERQTQVTAATARAVAAAAEGAAGPAARQQRSGVAEGGTEDRRPPARASRSERRAEAVRPVKGPLTSPFGQRWGRLHAGLDFGVPVGTPVVAVADGVVEARYDASGYGHYVVVQHADRTSSLYAHLSKVLVDGGRVQAGDAVGRSGNTGHSTGPHLHFEIRTEQGPTDPRPWLRRHGVTV